MTVVDGEVVTVVDGVVDTVPVGVVLGVAVLALLVVFASLRKSRWEVISCAVYGTTFILLFLGSTLYHAVQHPRAKRVLKTIDHSAIYLELLRQNNL